MAQYDDLKAEIERSLRFGIMVESDDPDFEEMVTSISEHQIKWISAWLANDLNFDVLRKVVET